jgi:hypothetical protein
MEENMPGGSSLKIYEYLAKVSNLIIIFQETFLFGFFYSYSVNKNHQLLEPNLTKKTIG